ncbi:hypothetical protein DPMN_040080 [Dreissena polymorpha]|uniref:Uncharacterized protein n=1 Tax=Dreissena polymorpha TaxID=45954 RepID=A0A9D4CUD5_DREPO|nr:hypothetical protein DPMN_040080 [Dreissena polymorpha]
MQNLLQFELEDLSLTYVFSKLEEAQKDLNIEDYSERHDSASSLPTSCLRLRPVSIATRRSTADPGDDELLADAYSSDVAIEADDQPLLNLGGTGPYGAVRPASCLAVRGHTTSHCL